MQSQLNFYWKCFLSRGAEIEGGTQQRRPSEGSGDSHTCPQQTPTTGHRLLQSGSCSLTVNIFQTLVSSIVKKKKPKQTNKQKSMSWLSQQHKSARPALGLSQHSSPWCCFLFPADEHGDKAAEPALTPHSAHSSTITLQYSEQMT